MSHTAIVWLYFLVYT